MREKKRGSLVASQRGLDSGVIPSYQTLGARDNTGASASILNLTPATVPSNEDTSTIMDKPPVVTGTKQKNKKQSSSKSFFESLKVSLEESDQTLKEAESEPDETSGSESDPDGSVVEVPYSNDGGKPASDGGKPTSDGGKTSSLEEATPGLVVIIRLYTVLGRQGYAVHYHVTTPLYMGKYSITMSTLQKNQ